MRAFVVGDTAIAPANVTAANAIMTLRTMGFPPFSREDLHRPKRWWQSR
jgi:hypothetical protein